QLPPRSPFSLLVFAGKRRGRREDRPLLLLGRGSRYPPPPAPWQGFGAPQSPFRAARSLGAGGGLAARSGAPRNSAAPHAADARHAALSCWRRGHVRLRHGAHLRAPSRARAATP